MIFLLVAQLEEEQDQGVSGIFIEKNVFCWVLFTRCE